MGSQKIDVWQHWHNYLYERMLHLNNSVPQAYQDCFTTLHSIMQEEMGRAVYEWNWLQFQKVFDDWQGQWTPTAPTTNIFSYTKC